MNLDQVKTTEELPLHRVQRSHADALTEGQIFAQFYPWKPLTDKGLAKSLAPDTFCYTWRTSQGPDARLFRKKGPG